MTNYLDKTSLQVRDLHAIRQENPNIGIPDDADLSEIGYAKWIFTPPPQHDKWVEKVVEGVPVMVSAEVSEMIPSEIVEISPEVWEERAGYKLVTSPEVWGPQWEIVPLTDGEIADTIAAEKGRLTAAATAQRWANETGGIALPDGTRIGTALEDQNRITSVIANAKLAGVESVDFKAATGWVSLSLAEVQGIAAAIAIHVQGCFSTERAHHEAIDGLTTLAAASAYDLSIGWP